MSWGEGAAAVFGLLGTGLLAGRSRHAGWGFVAYLLSNALWIRFALDHGHTGLLLQQIGFTVASVWGVHTWLIKGKK